MTICNDMSYIYESDRRKRIEFRSPVYADYPGGIVDPSPELSPKIAWNGNEDLREYTWSNLPNVFDCASSEERYLTGIASMKLSPHPRCLLSPPSHPPWIRPTFSEARPAIDPSSILYISVGEVWHCKPV